MQGIYSINKSVGPTSNDVVMRIKKITGIKKVGHAGTLDPLAEGVLVIGVGRESTRQLGKIVEGQKEYRAVIKLGQTSITDDEEGMKVDQVVLKRPEEKDVKKVLKKFIGDKLQVAPKFSAVKIRGKEAYKRARQGEKFEAPPRQVEIKRIELKEYQWPILKIKVATGPGVYIRALARDIGEELETGGYLRGLTRTRVGGYWLKNSMTIEEFEKQIKKTIPS